ncbi:MAG TPA: dienelactone hydrolase family protein [Thermomicrobiales bacterium]|nr:dienelactone hydrolase family protein [Thermomicrobiales bacterium]
MGQWLTVGPDDNRAYLAVPDGGTGPGVLVLHAWWGLTEPFANACDRLAEAGFVALAPSLYENDATATTIPEAEVLVARHDANPDDAGAVILAASELLRSNPAVSGTGIGAIGFSLGAWWAFHLSQQRPDDIAAVVAVYGTNDGDFTLAKAAYQGHFAENDDFEPLGGVNALETAIREAGREVGFHIYPDTGHWFVEPNQPDAYNAEAAALFWQRTLAFLANHLQDA